MKKIIKNIVKQIFCIFIYIMLPGCEADFSLGPDPWVSGYGYQNQSHYNGLNEYNDWIAENEDTDLPCGNEIYLNITAPSLDIDNNGFYHILLLNGYEQTFSTLIAETGIDGYTVPISWGSDTYYLHTWGGFVDTVGVVNPSSYTNSVGDAHTVFSAWNSFVGDTITIYSSYKDNCYIEHFDSLKIVVEE